MGRAYTDKICTDQACTDQAPVRVEVAFAAPDRQVVVSLSLPAGASIRDAVEASGLLQAFPEHDLPALEKGVWGEKKPDDSELRDGDRVEIYRPLRIDAREARRRRAQRQGGA